MQIILFIDGGFPGLFTAGGLATAIAQIESVCRSFPSASFIVHFPSATDAIMKK